MLSRVSFALALIWTGSAWAQTVISAHSGVIQYVEGQVTLDGKTVEPKFAEFPDVKAGQTLAAQDGRAEVLLTPGVFLRIAENSSFRMESNKLADTRIEVLSGSALVEVGELLKDNAITLQVHDTEMALLQKGLYRVDAGDPGRLRVFKGEARLTSGSNTITAKGGREVELGAVLEARSFSSNDTDAFYRWSARRDEYVAEANLSAAKSASSGGGGMGFGSSGMGAGSGAGMWGWNQWYGMFTYVPYDGMYTSPFGYAFYSPLTVGAFYAPYYYGGYSGYSGRPVAGSNPYNGRPLSSPARPGISTPGTSAGLAGGGGVARSSAGMGGGAVSAGGAGARAGGGSRGR